MSARKAFHDLGFKMGDGTLAFWKFAHKSEPIVVYSVILGVLGPVVAFLGPKYKPLQRQVQNAPATSGNKKMTSY